MCLFVSRQHVMDQPILEKLSVLNESTIDFLWSWNNLFSHYCVVAMGGALTAPPIIQDTSLLLWVSQRLIQFSLFIPSGLEGSFKINQELISLICACPSAVVSLL